MRVGFKESRANTDDLRNAFDASFAAPENSVVEAHERMLAIRVGETRFAVRASEIAGVELIGKIVPLPNPMPGLLGIAGVRRRVVAVHDLGYLLGIRRGNTSPRWLILAANQEAGLAFAFDALEGFLEVAQSRIHPMERTDENEYAVGMVAENEALWPLLDLPRLTAHTLGMARMELRGTEKR